MPRAAGKIRVLIADPQPIFRDGLRQVLEGERDIEVVGDTGDGEQTIRLVRSLAPDIVLLDPALPRTEGLETLRNLSQISHTRTLPILMAAALDREELVEAIRLGARGVLSKDASRDLLLRAIRSVMTGQYWLGREEVSDVVRRLVSATPDSSRRNGDSPVPSLTPRERDVIHAVVQGLSNREIAARLAVSEDTVKHHLTNVYDKVGVSSRVELVVYAMSHDLLDAQP
jgi:two-component system, NarL family, nitrate/nitrite response regulator NarL